MKRKIVLVALVLILAVGAAVTFYSAERDLAPVASDQSGVFTPEPDPGQSEPDSGQPTLAPDVAVSKMVVNDKAGISVVMSIEPDQQTEDNVVITVLINTHGGDLSGYDIARLTSVELDGKRLNISGVKFKEQSLGDPHHRSGALSIPRTIDGSSWMGADSSKLQIIAKDIPKGTNRVLTWAQPWQWAKYER